MYSSARAMAQAACICSRVALGSAQRRLLAMVPENREPFCSTMDTPLRRFSRVYSRTSRPSTFTVPDRAS